MASAPPAAPKAPPPSTTAPDPAGPPRSLQPHPSDSAPSSSPPPRARSWLFPLLGVVALAGGAAWFVARWGLVETDNAQLQGHLTELSSRAPWPPVSSWLSSVGS